MNCGLASSDSILRIKSTMAAKDNSPPRKKTSICANSNTKSLENIHKLGGAYCVTCSLDIL